MYQPSKKIENSKVPVAIDNYLINNPNIEHIVIHFDNDIAGRNATNAFHINITDENDMKDFPEKVKISARQLSKEKGYETGYCFSLQGPSYSSLMMYCSNSETRKKMYYEYGHKCNGGEFSNIEIILSLSVVFNSFPLIL